VREKPPEITESRRIVEDIGDGHHALPRSPEHALVERGARRLLVTDREPLRGLGIDRLKIVEGRTHREDEADVAGPGLAQSGDEFARIALLAEKVLEMLRGQKDAGGVFGARRVHDFADPAAIVEI